MQPVDLYAAYVRERMGGEVEIEPGKGFATWKLLDVDPLVAQQTGGRRDAYLVDIFVAPDFRREGLAYSLANRVAEKAKKRGATRMIGSVETRALTRSDATKAILAAGFELTHVEGTVIWFAKEIA